MIETEVPGRHAVHMSLAAVVAFAGVAVDGAPLGAAPATP
jgi:hypothetical protein